MGLGYGFCENIITDNGMILNPSFVDYKLIRSRDMPQIELMEVPTYEPEGPYGAKESAEGTVAPTSPAVANAIYNAVGVKFDSNFLRPEKVLKTLKEKEAKEKGEGRR
jgi:4-hydroxybenzoyl-CoA reductase subunit alpha